MTQVDKIIKFLNEAGEPLPKVKIEEAIGKLAGGTLSNLVIDGRISKCVKVVRIRCSRGRGRYAMENVERICYGPLIPKSDEVFRLVIGTPVAPKGARLVSPLGQ